MGSDRAVPEGDPHLAEVGSAANEETGNVAQKHVTVNQVGHVENAILGNNYGIIIQQGVDKHRLASPKGQYVSIDEADLIQLLQPIIDASHTRDRETSPPNSACFPGTRKSVISRIVAWADSTLLWNTHVLWLYGYVGCGKSAIALSIALKFEQRNRLVGSFFFFRNTGDRSRMIKFATTLACQLAAAIPGAAPFIRRAVMEEPGLLQSSLVAQLRRLVYEPFKAAVTRGVSLLGSSLFSRPYLVVIDGLDECEDRREVQAFIDDMLEFFKKNPFVPLRFLITSRVEQHIQRRLKRDQVRLENLVNHCSRDDIDTFMKICFEEERRRNPVIMAYIQANGEWPMRADMDTLVDHIDGSFIFASALFKYIVDPTDDSSTPMERLPHTLKMNPGLDTLYSRTLSRSQHLPRFSDVISTLALLEEPLPISGIAELLGMESFEVVRVLVNLQAVIHIPGTDDLPVTFCHTSLRDFLTSESRSGCFFAPVSHHLLLSFCCFVLKDKTGPRTAATSYGTAHFDQHLKKFVRFHPEKSMIARRVHNSDLVLPELPLFFDTVYNHILARFQDIPFFSDIISTIALVEDPLTVVSIAGLLGIQAPQVSRVLDSSRFIINTPRIGGVISLTFRHSSLRDFLSTKTRAGPYYIQPSSHLRLSFHYFDLDFRSLSEGGFISDDDFTRCARIGTGFLSELDPEQILEILGRLAPTSQKTPAFSSHHFFSFCLLFFWMFDSYNRNVGGIARLLMRCVDYLALAVECHRGSAREPSSESKWTLPLLPPRSSPFVHWLGQHFRDMGFHGRRSPSAGTIVALELCQEQFEALQRDIQRLRTAIRKKHSYEIDEAKLELTRFNVDNLWLDHWTPIEAYEVGPLYIISHFQHDLIVGLQLLEWIVRRLKTKMDDAPQGTLDVVIDVQCLGAMKGSISLF